VGSCERGDEPSGSGAMVLVLLAGQMDDRGSSEITNCLLRLFSENKRGGNKTGFMAGQWPKQKNISNVSDAAEEVFDETTHTLPSCRSCATHSLLKRHVAYFSPPPPQVAVDIMYLHQESNEGEGSLYKRCWVCVWKRLASSTLAIMELKIFTVSALRLETIISVELKHGRDIANPVQPAIVTF
jgi:hypothetical protein